MEIQCINCDKRPNLKDMILHNNTRHKIILDKKNTCDECFNVFATDAEKILHVRNSCEIIIARKAAAAEKAAVPAASAPSSPAPAPAKSPVKPDHSGPSKREIVKRSLTKVALLDIAKVRLNVVVIGHADSGKSTTAGHLVCKKRAIMKEELTLIEKEACRMKKTFSKYAFVFDTLKAERERGVTIDICKRYLETERAFYTIIDAPGHRDFIRNMITGTSQADCAVLVVDSNSLAFEAGMCKNGQTHEHVILAVALGVTKLICCVNKMDAINTAYSEVRFNDIKRTVEQYMTKVGVRVLTYIPISALKGDNLIEHSENFSWYNGPTLLGALETVNAPVRPVDKPLRLPIHMIYKIGGIGTVPAGRVATGIMSPGMNLTFGPTGLTADVKSIQIHGKSLLEATPGDVVGFNVKDVAVKDLKKGYVASNSEDDPAKGATSFISKVVILNHPGKIREGYTPILDCHTSHTAVRFDKIVSKIKMRSEEVIENEPEFLKKDECGLVKMVPTKAMVVEPYSEYPPLGRFAVRDMRQTIAVGVIESVEKLK